ncbi:MAG: DMT family transporter [Alphaproteobacteria bacterium]|nr:DMT family transporter [Alphaproteobacteria bacterium]
MTDNGAGPNQGARTAAQGTVLGPALTLVSASAFALNTPIAALTYDSGVTPIALVVLRSAFTAAFVFLAFHALTRGPGLRDCLSAPLAIGGVLLMAQGVFYLASVAYIPVGLAALVFYTWPMIVAALSPLVGGAAPSRAQWLCFLVAFAGLASALGPDLAALDWRGLALVCCGSLCVAAYILMSRRFMQTTSLAAAIVTTNGIGMLAGLAAAPLFGGLILPQTDIGWAGVAALCVLFVLALMTQLAAIRITEARTVALLFNLEPVISIIAGAVLLSEILTPNQYAGGAVVLGAVLIYTRLSSSP